MLSRVASNFRFKPSHQALLPSKFLNIVDAATDFDPSPRRPESSFHSPELGRGPSVVHPLALTIEPALGAKAARRGAPVDARSFVGAVRTRLDVSGRAGQGPAAARRGTQHDVEPPTTPRRRAGGHVCRGQLRHDERERLGARLRRLGALPGWPLLRRRRAARVPRRHLRCIGEGDVINVHGYV